MTIKEIRSYLKGKSLINKQSVITKFINENTFRVNGQITNSFNYELYEKENIIYFKHNLAFGTEDLELTVTSENPLVLTLNDLLNEKVNFTWKELQDHR